jgi:hypothetical protein
MLATTHAAAWVEFAADLVSARSDRLQSSRINRQLELGVSDRLGAVLRAQHIGLLSTS